MATYPENEKVAAVRDQSQAIGEFLEWLDHGYVIAEFDERDGIYVPVRRSPQAWLYQYFDIDPQVVEEERRAMLEAIRAMNEAVERKPDE